jgi:hypothetical protein
MQESLCNNDEMFHLIVRLLSEEESWRSRLVRSHEIVARLLQSKENRAAIGLARHHRSGESAEQWVANIVASFGQCAITSGSEWQSSVEVMQMSGEWFFRLKLVDMPIASLSRIGRSGRRATDAQR